MKRFPSFTFLLTILQQYSWPVNLLPFSRRKWRVSGVNPFCFLISNLQINWADIQPHLLSFNHKRWAFYLRLTYLPWPNAHLFHHLKTMLFHRHWPHPQPHLQNTSRQSTPQPLPMTILFSYDGRPTFGVLPPFIPVTVSLYFIFLFSIVL